MGSNNGREEKEVYRRHSEAWMDGVQGSIYGMSLIWGDQTGRCRAAESLIIIRFQSRDGQIR